MLIQRRAADLGFRVKIGCHTFVLPGITAYLEAGGTLENAQAMAAHPNRPNQPDVHVPYRTFSHARAFHPSLLVDLATLARDTIIIITAITPNHPIKRADQTNIASVQRRSTCTM